MDDRHAVTEKSNTKQSSTKLTQNQASLRKEEEDDYKKLWEDRKKWNQN